MHKYTEIIIWSCGMDITKKQNQVYIVAVDTPGYVHKQPPLS